MTAEVWIMLVLTAAGTLVSALHYALRDFSLVKLQAIAAARGGKVADHLVEDAASHVLATGFLRSLCNVAITVCIVLLFHVLEAAPGGGEPGPGGALTLNFPRLLGAFAAASAVIYLFGIVIPMSIAEHAGERLIASSSLALHVLRLVAWPLRGLSLFDSAIRRLAGAHHVTEQEQMQEDILAVAAEGHREGTIGETERAMIEAVVSFSDRTVEEIMTPRTEIEGFELTDDLGFIQRFIQERGHSRIPVYQGDLDHIVGVLYAKDLIKYLGTDPSKFKLRPVLRRPVWVPETKSLSELMIELRSRKVHLAIVLDEYGGTAGLVTFEDLLEEIVGEIQDEYEPQDEVQPVIDVRLDQRVAEIEARAYVGDVNEALTPMGIEVPESDEYDTMAGYVLVKLGHIPVAGERLEEGDLLITVLEAEPTRVVKIRLEARAAGDETDAEEGERRDDESPAFEAGVRPA
ncbi:MAG: hemolysin family protein [Planctomycetota bacterium]|nr:hemolysin family protein [Planctomycetota bacterium]